MRGVLTSPIPDLLHPFASFPAPFGRGVGGQLEASLRSADNSWKGKQLEGDREDIFFLLQPLLLSSQRVLPPHYVGLRLRSWGDVTPCGNATSRD